MEGLKGSGPLSSFSEGLSLSGLDLKARAQIRLDPSPKKQTKLAAGAGFDPDFEASDGTDHCFVFAGATTIVAMIFARDG